MGHTGGLFGRIAVEKALCTEAQLAFALRTQEELRAVGLSKPLGVLLVADGVLTDEQVGLVIRLQKLNESVRREKAFAKVAVRNGLATAEQVDQALEAVRESGHKRALGDVLVERGVLSPTSERAIRLALDRARARERGAPEPEPLPGSPAGPATAKLGVALDVDREEDADALALEKRVRDVLFAAVALREGLVLLPELERALRDQLAQPGEPLLESVLGQRGILSAPELAAASNALERSRTETISIPGYVLVDLLGRGVTSIVLRARHEVLGREVAIKLFRTEHVAATHADALAEEARSVARIRHANVVGLYDVGRVHRRVYYVMELVDGPTLEETVRKNGPLPVGEALRIAREVASALDAIHEAGLVHRDVKPQNVLLAKDGTAKLADLGLACEVGLPDEAPGAIFGSPCFMAPEQAQGQAVDIRADLYGLGATFYFALTGRPPYEGTDAVGLMIRHLTDPVPDPRARRPEVPEAAASLVATLMAKSPDDRPVSPFQAISLFEQAQASDGASASTR